MGPAGPAAPAGLSGIRSRVRRGQPPARRAQDLPGREGPHHPPIGECAPMSEENRPPAVAQWGRPLRKRARGPQAQPARPGAPAVGPVDDPAHVGGGEPVEGAGEAAGLTPPPRSYEAPPPRSYDAPPPRSYENPPPRSYEVPRPGHP